MSNSLAVRATNVSKVFKLYNQPIDRLKEAIHPCKKSYSRNFSALSDISFSLKSGESLGVVGKNGSGKSTLLKLVTGILSPSSGNVEVNGKVSSLLELGIGFDPELTGIQNLFLYGSLMGLGGNEMEERLEDIVTFADIGEFINQPVKTFSSGMFARLAFAAAINVTPNILIVDEVLSVGDSAFQKKCVSRIQELRKLGVSLILVSHDEYLVRKVCEKAIFLEKGKCKYVGDTERCLTEYKNSYRVNTIVGANFDSEECLEQSNMNFHFTLDKVETKDKNGEYRTEFESGEDIFVYFTYHLNGYFDGKISFVVNIYSSDGTYVFGTTSLMDRLEPFYVNPGKRICFRLVAAPLLSGPYSLRLAINDSTGMSIYCEANPAAEFLVTDNFEAVGLVNLKRKWEVPWKD